MRPSLNWSSIGFVGLAVVAAACGGTSSTIGDPTEASGPDGSTSGGSGGGSGGGSSSGGGSGNSSGGATGDDDGSGVPDATTSDGAGGGVDGAADTGPGGGNPDAAPDSSPGGGSPDSGVDSGSSGGGPDAGGSDGGKSLCSRAANDACAVATTCCGADCCTAGQLCCLTPGVVATPAKASPGVLPVESYKCVMSDSGACPPSIITCGPVTAENANIICPQQ
jgi:hypothetical protein